MTSLLKRFVDFATGEVTADVNNSKTTTDQASIAQVAARAELTTDQTIQNDTLTQVNLDNEAFEDSDIATVDLNNDVITIIEDGTYIIKGRVTILGSANWSIGDQVLMQIRDFSNNSTLDLVVDSHHGQNEELSRMLFAVEKVSGDTDFGLRVRFRSGSAEDVNGAAEATNVEISRVG